MDISLWFGLKLIPCFSPFLKDIQIGVYDLGLDVSTNSEPKWDIYLSKAKFGYWQPETKQILKIEDMAIVSWLGKHFAFFFNHPISLWVISVKN